mmetsp:Transcript_11510/g.17340  ORF Transcript_11510/g.17340 Transcript_11510/m.17340 type:complete len:298 (-) Transcript_11510:92-985(-)
MGDSGARSSLRIAFIGNSFTFFNNAPGVLMHLLKENLPATVAVETSVVLRGGKSFTTLWSEGSDFKRAAECAEGQTMVATVAELLADPLGWDLVVLQDFSQGPARPEQRQESLDALKDLYVPALLGMKAKTGKTPLVVMYKTWGYLQACKNSEEIGDFKVMTRKLAGGYYAFASLLEDAGLPVTVADCGAFFEALFDRSPKLWEGLYQSDFYHPKPLGTFLIACVFLTTIARHPMFAHRFPTRLKISTTWPEHCVPSKPVQADDPDEAMKQKVEEVNLVPSDETLVNMLRTVGGFLE